MNKILAQILRHNLMLAGVNASYATVFGFHSRECQLLKAIVDKSHDSGVASKYLLRRSIVITILSDDLVSHCFRGIQPRGNLCYRCRVLSIYTG